MLRRRAGEGVNLPRTQGPFPFRETTAEETPFLRRRIEGRSGQRARAAHRGQDEWRGGFPDPNSCIVAGSGAYADEARLLDREWMKRASPVGVEALLGRGASLDARGGIGQTPLHVAARSSENPEIMALLLERGRVFEAGGSARPDADPRPPRRRFGSGHGPDAGVRSTSGSAGIATISFRRLPFPTREG